MAIKRVAAVHDLSCFGRGSLTTVLPVLSACGIQACPLPGSLLSTHTDGFPGFFMEDLSGPMERILEHWATCGLRFDGIYSGFLGGPGQAGLVRRLQTEFLEPDGLICVDPVLGDGGALYPTFDRKMVSAMRELIGGADLITPNWTEACLLTGEAYEENPADKRVYTLGERLLSLGARRAVITGVEQRGEISTFGFEPGKEPQIDRRPGRAGAFPSAGDLFCSVLLGRLLGGEPFCAALKRACDFCDEAIALTVRAGTPRRDGIRFEPLLHTL